MSVFNDKLLLTINVSERSSDKNVFDKLKSKNQKTLRETNN